MYVIITSNITTRLSVGPRLCVGEVMVSGKAWGGSMKSTYLAQGVGPCSCQLLWVTMASFWGNMVRMYMYIYIYIYMYMYKSRIAYSTILVLNQVS